jgi:hypothetical protein
MDTTFITIRIVRDRQALPFGEDASTAYTDPISGFIVSDNGEGFHEDNMMSFRTLDSEYKSQYGGRGVGRLLWLKAFERVEVLSQYRDNDTTMKEREFVFTVSNGVSRHQIRDTQTLKSGTQVRLLSFKESYRQNALKTAIPIAKSILEHCLWYFVRPGGAPNIAIIDDS